MADSPSKNKDRVLACTVYCNGSKLPDTFSLVSASVRLSLNRIGKATLRFNAGNMDKQTFDESDNALFKPGNPIKLDAGSTNKQETLFEGNIIGLRILTGKDFRSYMVVECRDCAYPATQGRKNRIFEKQKDSDIIKEVLKTYGSVDVDATQYQHPTLVQYYCSDWDFALSRADACGLFVFTDGSKIKVKKPTVSGSPVLTVTYGEDITAFDLELTADDQFTQYEAVSWSPKEQKAVKVSASTPSLNKQGDLQPKSLASGDSLLLQTDAPTEEKALKQWVDGMALKAGLARYQGSVSFYGSALVKPGTLIELKGLGKRFNGNLFVGSVTHTIEDNEWTTEAGAGVPAMNITDEPDVVSPPAAGFLPGLQGLHAAVVKKLDGDPQKAQRIQIELPWLDGKSKLLWARLATMYATNGMGTYFLPEVNDEVLVGFMNADPTHPVILGSLYSEKHKPPFEYEAKNNTKAIVTREKLRIEFDEEKKVITVATPGKNTLEISDDGKSITLTDQHKNEIKMDSGGITLTSHKDITLKAKGGITLDATSKISGTAKSDISLDGMNVKVQAKVGATVKGNATAELSATGQTTVKGAMVMIN
ncbi:type VI secretion system tip protein VgrG [Bacteroides caecigallinarum]|uniref:type VI secretion system tip protein VgrG n=1 Tax=Bacteroides caecigallinarum TaxID=1411144 RepID=UPI001F32BD40|nr:type VI secretion system tip protein VgrG [Bacteroides caecigallinarum]MCF2738662.1 type VI secretion system tip protein VgrG [Bacteroides caecigallinarum]